MTEHEALERCVDALYALIGKGDDDSTMSDRCVFCLNRLNGVGLCYHPTCWRVKARALLAELESEPPVSGVVMLPIVESPPIVYDDSNEPQPIGRCKKCGTALYIREGFCGVCEPHRV